MRKEEERWERRERRRVREDKKSLCLLGSRVFVIFKLHQCSFLIPRNERSIPSCC